MSPKQRGRVKRLEPRLLVAGGDRDALARYYGTDKGSAPVSPIAPGHNYTRLYERHLAAGRKRVPSVLEIGFGGTTSVDGYETPAGGQSLRMWQDYFPKATVVGIDIHHKEVSGPRIRFEHGDATDPGFLPRVIDAYGLFDIVIDDGSHLGREIRAAFGVLGMP